MQQGGGQLEGTATRPLPPVTQAGVGVNAERRAAVESRAESTAPGVSILTPGVTRSKSLPLAKSRVPHL